MVTTCTSDGKVLAFICICPLIQNTLRMKSKVVNSFNSRERKCYIDDMNDDMPEVTNLIRLFLPFL